MNTKYLFITSIILLIFSISISFGQEQNDLEIVEKHPNLVQNEIDSNYKNYEIDFYTTPGTYKVQRGKRKTIQKDILVKPAHREGATFKKAMIQYLYRPEQEAWITADTQYIDLITNAKTNRIRKLVCVYPYEENEFQKKIIPAQYKTLVKEILIEDGKGNLVPETYKTVRQQIVMEPIKVVPNFNPTGSYKQRFKFTIPKTTDIHSYLKEQIAQQSIKGCIDEDSYQVVGEINNKNLITRNYTDHEVDFFTAHNDVVVMPTKFKSSTKKVMVKPAYQEGAIFKKVHERYLYKPEHTVWVTADTQYININTNAETNTIKKLACIIPYKESAFKKVIVPAQYKIIARHVIIKVGTGSDIPAQYKTITTQIIEKSSFLNPRSVSDRTFERIKFRILDNMTIQDYIDIQLKQQSMTDCMEEHSYQIVK